MNLQQRIDLLSRLGDHMLSADKDWQQAKEKAFQENPWFIPAFIDLAVDNIARSFLQRDILEKWTFGLQNHQQTPQKNIQQPRLIGIVMAGNIPLVGFHDWLCVFISGQRSLVKPSSKDQALIRHLLEKTGEWDPEAKKITGFSEILRGCNAYIATGSNNSSRYFDYYFGRYPHMIRRNKTSVAILTGNETADELEGLSNDVHLYFGLGCRNVTKIYVPARYDFVPLLESFKKSNYFSEHHRYRNNYDYNLALHLLNNKHYMTNGSILLVENPALFSPISQLNYEFYNEMTLLERSLEKETDLQCIMGKGHIPFGRAQRPAISDYADGVNTLEFLGSL